MRATGTMIAGSVLRLDRRVGVSGTYAGGLSHQVLGVGGATGPCRQRTD